MLKKVYEYQKWNIKTCQFCMPTEKKYLKKKYKKKKIFLANTLVHDLEASLAKFPAGSFFYSLS